MVTRSHLALIIPKSSNWLTWRAGSKSKESAPSRLAEPIYSAKRNSSGLITATNWLRSTNCKRSCPGGAPRADIILNPSASHFALGKYATVKWLALVQSLAGGRGGGPAPGRGRGAHRRSAAQARRPLEGHLRRRCGNASRRAARAPWQHRSAQDDGDTVDRLAASCHRRPSTIYDCCC